jgi:hypothetical protein
VTSTTAVAATAVESATSNARPPAGGKASGISAVIKAAEPASVHSRLRVKVGTAMNIRAPVKTRRPMESTAMIEAAVAEVAVSEITMMEPVMTELSAMRLEFVMVEECSTVVPVISPVVPAPAKSSEEADTKSKAKGKADAA